MRASAGRAVHLLARAPFSSSTTPTGTGTPSNAGPRTRDTLYGGTNTTLILKKNLQKSVVRRK